MTDAVDSLVVETNNRYYKVKITNRSDGTGESGVVKVDKSTLVASNGLEPRNLIIDLVEGSIGGFTSVRFDFDHTTDDEALTLAPGPVYVDYRDVGGIRDPLSAGGTGDLLCTTVGAVSGAVYDLTLSLRLQSQV